MATPAVNHVPAIATTTTATTTTTEIATTTTSHPTENATTKTSAAKTESSGCCTGKPKKPLMPLDGISITESFFFQSNRDRPQVIMSLGMRWKAHPDMHVTVPRLLELIQLAAAQHFRLASLLDARTLTFKPMGQVAKDITLNYRIVERQNADTWKKTQRGEVNINFDLDNPKLPIWRTAIVIPKHKFVEYKASLARDAGKPSAAVGPSSEPTVPEAAEPYNGSTQETQEESVKNTEPAAEGLPTTVSVETPAPVELAVLNADSSNNLSSNPEEDVYYDVIFSLHHSLGDGLAGYIFLRTFFQLCDVKHMNAPSLNLDNVPISLEIPPVFDNLIKPNVFAVIPAAMEIVYNTLVRKTKARIKARKLSRPTSMSTEDLETLLQMTMGPGTLALSPEDRSTNPSNILDQAGEPKQPQQISSSTFPPMAGKLNGGEGDDGKPENPTGPGISMLRITGRSSTNVKYLFFDAQMTEALRKKCKSERTTITSFMVVNAMAAIRTCFADLPKYSKSGLPSHQGWVITTSLRHLLPVSKLLTKGADRETDPSMNILGGYAGSLSNPSMRIVDKNDLFERSRSVGRYMSFGYLKSIQRTKLLNFCYRRPKLFEFLRKSINLKKISRTLSVEVANLGAWTAPKAPLGSTDPEELARSQLTEYYGTINASFDGARAIFTLGSITLDGSMSMTVAYDTRVVKDREANLFAQTFRSGVEKAIQATGKFTVKEARTCD